MNKITKLFDKPKVIGLLANTNEGKSNTIYYVIDELNKESKFSLYVYGLKKKPKNAIEIHSVEELERIENSLIVVDEMFTLFDLDNRKIKKQIENTIRLVFHNNNILLLCGLGENFKKFLSAKLHMVMFKTITLTDLINGSRVKDVVMNYKGNEKGTTLLKLKINELLVYDGKHYNKFNIPYMKEYDSKAKNKPIFRKCANSVPKIVEKDKCDNEKA